MTVLIKCYPADIDGNFVRVGHPSRSRMPSLRHFPNSSCPQAGEMFFLWEIETTESQPTGSGGLRSRGTIVTFGKGETSKEWQLTLDFDGTMPAQEFGTASLPSFLDSDQSASIYFVINDHVHACIISLSEEDEHQLNTHFQ